MKTLSILLFALFFSSLGLTAQSSTLTITISNIKEAKGEIRLGLYKPSDKWAKGNTMSIQKIVKVDRKPTMTITIPNVEYGTYAISYLQDVNENGKMDYRMWIPTEPFGFSNNPKVKWSEPSFKECSFEVSKPSMEINVKNQYW